MTRIETALSRMLLEEQEAGDHNPACIDTGCPVAAELVDVAERSLATPTGAALSALVEAAEAFTKREAGDIGASIRLTHVVEDFIAATEPQTAGGER